MSPAVRRRPGPLDGVEIKPLPDDWWEQQEREREEASAVSAFGKALASLGARIDDHRRVSANPVSAILGIERRLWQLSCEVGPAIRGAAVYR